VVFDLAVIAPRRGDPQVALLRIDPGESVLVDRDRKRLDVEERFVVARVDGDRGEENGAPLLPERE
jgi:hypothetical protein